MEGTDGRVRGFAEGAGDLEMELYNCILILRGGVCFPSSKGRLLLRGTVYIAVQGLLVRIAGNCLGWQVLSGRMG